MDRDEKRRVGKLVRESKRLMARSAKLKEKRDCLIEESRKLQSEVEKLSSGEWHSLTRAQAAIT